MGTECFGQGPHASTGRVPLHDQWEFRREDSETWKPVVLPSSFEAHEGTDFDGVGWYRRRLKREAWPDDVRVALRFEGAATEATVWCDGQEVGRHLGGWTPFECDITSQVRKSAEGDAGPEHVEVLVRVDEMVGHNSQGFLPVFAPHFGGLWKDVSLHVGPAVHIDSDTLFGWGDTQSGLMRVEVPIVDAFHRARTERSGLDGVRVGYRRRAAQGEAPQEWREGTHVALTDPQQQELSDRGRVDVPIAFSIDAPALWSPEDPALYELRVMLLRDQGAMDDPNALPAKGGAVASEDTVASEETVAGFRTVAVDGEKLLLNGKPIQVRGILNWGYAPPRTAPSLDPEFWAKELDLLKAYGFNLMKFCLWVPPKEYLRMADERGILVWMEYPTWHSKWTVDQLPTLEREFDEFFGYDRSHPSVILRSLTCETGPSADLDVIRALYERCHEKIPGSIVEDDSSWIQWNRVHDFYDDHPYGNNHTWVATLDRLRTHIAQGEPKPLVLGEAIAADTWVDPESLTSLVGDERPFWLPGFLDANREWSDQRRRDMGEAAVERLESDSLDYAMRMRKYQIETYRREVPFGGYVVSVIRDFPFAGMGLMDFHGHPKWDASLGKWAWHGEQTLILKTENDRRSFRANESFRGEMLLSSFADRGPGDGVLRWAISRREDSHVAEPTVLTRDTQVVLRGGPGVIALDVHEVPWNGLVKPSDTEPVQIRLEAELILDGATVSRNEWELWVVPETSGRQPSVEVHDSCSASVHRLVHDQELGRSSQEHAEVIVAQRFDLKLFERLEGGARVLMLPDGERHSFPLQSHWFLRGGPIVHSAVNWDALHPMLRELQHFDLASDVVPDLQWLNEATPLFMLWDNHDMATVKTHGLMFATQVGRGTLMVCALNLEGETNAAGGYVAARCLESLADPASPQSLLHGCSLASLSDGTLQGIRDHLRAHVLPLTDRDWQFREDPEDQGLAQNWQRASAEDRKAWGNIRIGSHWESQGHPNLDGWAWYATDLEVPEDWDNQEAYLWVDGGDDYYEVYVNGEPVGSAGDRVTKATAFEERSTFRIPSHPSVRRYHIAIRVLDWGGAGGMFRPIHWSSTPRPRGPRLLK
jgi:hypothetical protein